MNPNKQEIKLWKHGRRIDAIKSYRIRTNVKLIECKRIFEIYVDKEVAEYRHIMTEDYQLRHYGFAVR